MTIWLTARLQAQEEPAERCLDHIRIRVELPRVVRGPGNYKDDNHFNEIRLPDGKFRGFDAAGTTWAIDGDHPWAMGGTPVPVLEP
jgi:hypothetical protein